ncbi:unnamed protein product, partial [Iphiclides podalirius]
MTTHNFNLLFLIFTILACKFPTGKCDLPCRVRDVGIEGRSIVCVCDANYCDTITREAPPRQVFVAYTSSNAGQRFEKSVGVVQQETTTDDSDFGNTQDEVLLRVLTSSRKQFIEGFGGSVTDAAGINWRTLSDAAQKRFIDTYFGPEGLEYNLIRVPIGGADFSTHPYTYNELPWNDAALTNFSLSPEDFLYKLPMIKMAEAAATNRIKITASTWSPPIWMKTNERITGFGQVKPEFYQSYADYHLRFLEEYDKADVKVWRHHHNQRTTEWHHTGRWVANNLGPTIRNSRFNDTLILAVDDQRYTLSLWLKGMEREDPKSIEYIDGIAVHYYGNYLPGSVLTRIQNRYPDKILLSTEACEGAMPWDLNKVEVGSWRRAARYIKSILEDLNNHVVGWIDWNLCLDENGGPNWADNFVDAPIIVYGNGDEFIKQPMFYAMGHFSKFIPRGSRVVEVSRMSSAAIDNVAVVTPEGNIVVVLHNTKSYELKVRIRISSDRRVDLIVEPESVKTVEINRSL